MNKYYFIVSKIAKGGKFEQRTVSVSNKNKFMALNTLREMFPDPDYIIDYIDK